MSWCARLLRVRDCQDSAYQFPCKKLCNRNEDIVFKRVWWESAFCLRYVNHFGTQHIKHAFEITLIISKEPQIWVKSLTSQEKKKVRKTCLTFSLPCQINWCSVDLILEMSCNSSHYIERKHLFVITSLWYLDVLCQRWFFRHNSSMWELLFVLISMWQLRFLLRAS